MRLSEIERQAILGAIGTRDPRADVYLFGSRVDDNACGGDIDLLVLSEKIDFESKLDILIDLHSALGEQRIDLVVERDLSRPFTRIAVAEGVRL